MSKRKRDQGEAEAEDRGERNENKRRKHERRAAVGANRAVRHRTSIQLVNRVPEPQVGANRPKPAQRASKKQRRNQRREGETGETRHSTNPNILAKRGDLVSQEQDEKRKRRKERKKERKERRRDAKPQWKVSEPVGGQMINLDPLFSPGEESVLLTSCLVY